MWIVPGVRATAVAGAQQSGKMKMTTLHLCTQRVRVTNSSLFPFNHGNKIGLRV
jgi:hypothetical protein